MVDPDEDEIQILEHENALSATSSNTSNNSEFRGKLISDEAEIFSRQKYYKNVIFNCKLKHPENAENFSDDENLVTDDLPQSGEYDGSRHKESKSKLWDENEIRKSSFAQNSRRGSMATKTNPRSTLLGMGNPIAHLGPNITNNNAATSNQLGINSKDTSRVSQMIKAVGHIDISTGNYFAGQAELNSSNNNKHQPNVAPITEKSVEEDEKDLPTTFALPDSAKAKQKSKTKKVLGQMSNASMGMSEMASEVGEDHDGDLAIMHVGQLSEIRE